MGQKSTKRRSAYDRWRCIMRACYEPTRRSYVQYGGKGIRVAPVWDNNRTAAAFDNFYSWLCDRLEHHDDPDHYWVVRHDTNADFTPQNCYISLVHPMTAKCERALSYEEINAVMQIAKRNSGRVYIRDTAKRLRVPHARVYRILGEFGLDFTHHRLPSLVSCAV